MTFRYKISCSVCRRKKIKCDRVKPCAGCIHSGHHDICYETGSSVPSKKVKIRSKSQSQPCHDAVEISLAKYRAKLPRLEECIAAFHCQVAELRWYTSYLDRDSIRLLQEKLTTKKTSLDDLAYIFTLLALVGNVVPSNHPVYSMLSISSPISFDSHSRYAEEVLDLAEEQEPTRSASKKTLKARTEIRFLLAQQYFLTRNISKAIIHHEACLDTAEQSGLFKQQREDYSDEGLEAAIQSRFIWDITSFDLWMSYVRGIPKDQRIYCAFSIEETISLGLASGIMTKLDSIWLHFRWSSPYLGLKIRSVLGFTGPQNGIKLLSVQELDREIKSLEEKSLMALAREARDAAAQISKGDTSFESKIAYMTTTVRLYTSTLRCLLARSLLEDGSCHDKVSSSFILQSAACSIQCIRFSDRLLDSPLQRIILGNRTNDSVELGMSIFAHNIIDRRLVLPSIDDENTKSSLIKSEPKEILYMLGTFEQNYATLHRMGSVGFWTLKCAELLRGLPLYIQPSSMNTSNDSSRRSSGSLGDMEGLRLISNTMHDAPLQIV